MIELRSDTFTLPTPAMLAAIAQARLGNDDYGEDPTVLELEELAAVKVGKEAACLMPSGTMANLACLNAHCQGSRKLVLAGDESDIYVYEGESAQACPGAVYTPLPTQRDGTIPIGILNRTLQENGARVAVVCLENPHNLRGGVVLPLSYLEEFFRAVHSFGVPVHLDGARIFNAAVAAEVEVPMITQWADSLQFCLSKGLSAPVGSAVAGTSAFIERVRVIRKWLGGTMRQAGIIAAPGIIALQQMVDRLAEDHANARYLAEGLARIPGIHVDLSIVQTNTVVFSLKDNHFSCEQFIASAMRHGVNLSEFKHGRIRAVLHYGISREDVDEVLARLTHLMAKGPAAEEAYGLAARR